MEYLLLIYEDEKRWAQMGDKEQMSEMGECHAFREQFGAAIKAVNALQPTTTATTVRVRNGKRLATDGPFAETKEQLGGLYLIEAPNLDEAIAMAERIPAAPYGSIEIRPIMKLS